RPGPVPPRPPIRSAKYPEPQVSGPTAIRVADRVTNQAPIYVIYHVSFGSSLIFNLCGGGGDCRFWLSWPCGLWRGARRGGWRGGGCAILVAGPGRVCRVWRTGWLSSLRADVPKPAA